MSSWLTQIVLILLFAVVMDLVVPSSSMRNYVKLVMGLVIMVTMLKPISALYDNKFDISKIQWPGGSVPAASFESIREKAADLERQQTELAEQQVNGVLEKALKQHVEAAYPFEVARVSVRFAKSEQSVSHSAEIEELVLQVRPKSNESRTIQPVDPVSVRMGESGESARRGHTEESDKRIKQLKEELATLYRIPGSVISVQLLTD
ncbi:stage III sporulation protein AF [Effusibacillus lacus]|uniref:stage III sporulation protein AF n=1 Tax=Effusibacillus lacus TaxID=1348429 RepID=UPI0022B164CD|nr:stage III sporulation protein AF [Effusibacillus lacus]